MIRHSDWRRLRTSYILTHTHSPRTVSFPHAHYDEALDTLEAQGRRRTWRTAVAIAGEDGAGAVQRHFCRDTLKQGSAFKFIHV